MKTCSEMTENVLVKAKARIAEKKKRRAQALGAGVCGLCAAAVLVTSILGFWQTPAGVPGEDPTGTIVEETAVPRKATLTFVSSTNGKMERTEVVSGVKIPASMYIRVRDVRGVKEEDLARIMAEEQTKNQTLRKGWDLSMGMHGGNKAIISIVENGHLRIEVDNPSQVAKWQVETEWAGHVTQPGGWSQYSVSYPTAEGQQKEIKKGLTINWDLSHEAISMLENDPTTPLSTLSDVVTVTLQYKDGSREAIVIYLTVDDEGNVIVTHEGSTTENVPPLKKAALKLMAVNHEDGKVFPIDLYRGEPWGSTTYLRVRDLRDVKEEDLEAVKKEAYEKACASVYEGAFFTRVDTLGGKNALITMAHRCALVLDIAGEEYAQVADVSAQTTDMGTVTISQCEYPTGRGMFNNGAVALWLDWMPSEKLISMIEENPELPLSTIKDTITVTLKNADGSRETVVFEITLEDGGNMFATLREHKVEN